MVYLGWWPDSCDNVAFIYYLMCSRLLSSGGVSGLLCGVTAARFASRYLGGVAAARRHLLRRREGRPDAALHRLGGRDVAAGGLGIAALYLWGLRWWPGVLLGELVVNAELLLADAVPLGSLLGQQTGNMAEIVVGALLLPRLVGRRAALDRVDQVLGMFVALGVAAAISARRARSRCSPAGSSTASDALTFWRPGGSATSGRARRGPSLLAWSRPVAAWRRLRTPEGAPMVAAVIALGVIAVTIEEPVTYMVFPALIWAAFRFGPPGATLAIAIAAGVAIGITAPEVGPFFKQPIDHRTLGTQLYIVVTALTTLFLSAVVCERERSSAELAEARSGARASARSRSVSGSPATCTTRSRRPCSPRCCTRGTAQRALAQVGRHPPAAGPALDTIAELTRERRARCAR